MRSKVRGPDSLELALEMRKKKERMRNGHFFEHLVLACTKESFEGVQWGLGPTNFVAR